MLFYSTEITAFVCDKEWISYYDFCYHKLPLETNYRNAIDICGELHSEMLTIDTADEQLFVTRYLLAPESNLWLDSYNSKYENWLNTSTKLITGKCAVVHRLKRNEAKWIKEVCESENEVVCKKLSGEIVHTTKLFTETTEIPETTEFITTKTTTQFSTTTYNPTTISPNSCRQDWTRFRNKCYLVSLTDLEFEEANELCASKGGLLTSIHSKEENDFIMQLYQKSSSQQAYFIHIGGFNLTGNFH